MAFSYKVFVFSKLSSFSIVRNVLKRNKIQFMSVICYILINAI